jgi:protein-disulfide isomerase
MKIPLAVVVVLSIAVVAAPGFAQSNDEIAAIRREIEALKAGQAAIQNELQALRNALQQGRQAQAPAGGAPAVPENLEVSVGNAFTRGNTGARLTIVEFSDFQCPYCGRYVQQTFGQIDRDYLQTGKLRYVVRNMPLERIHPDAFRAAEAAECAGTQGKYWEMHDHLFAHQDALSADDLKKYAAEVKLDMPAFEQCLASGALADKIRKDMDDAQEAGITGTPTFLFGVAGSDATKVRIVGRIIGAHPYASFKSAIDGVLAAEPSR